MKTVLTEKIDGLSVVVGFSEPCIDRYSTEEKITPFLAELDESKEIVVITNKIKAQKIIIANASTLISTESLKSDTDKNKVLINETESKIVAAEEAIRTYENEINELLPVLTAKKIELMQYEAVYFEPKESEIIISSEEYQTLCDMTTDDKKLVIDVENNELSNPRLVNDFRNLFYYFKDGDSWLKAKILALGLDLPENCYFWGDLTEEQQTEINNQDEADRVFKLTDEEKESEFNTKKAAVLAASISLRSEREIEGDSYEQALEVSQFCYESEIDKLKIKYSITD